MSLDSNLGALLDVVQLVDRQAAILLFFPCDELPVELEGLTRAPDEILQPVGSGSSMSAGRNCSFSPKRRCSSALCTAGSPGGATHSLISMSPCFLRNSA